jgi:hypothetical protein
MPAQRPPTKRTVSTVQATAPTAPAAAVAAPEPFVVKLPLHAVADQVSAAPGASKRSKRRKAPAIADDSGEDSDNASVVACVDDERGGSAAARRAALLAKEEAISMGRSSELSEGTVSRRAFLRGSAKVRQERTKAQSTFKAQTSTTPTASDLDGSHPSSDADASLRNVAKHFPSNPSPPASLSSSHVDVQIPPYPLIDRDVPKPVQPQILDEEPDASSKICRDFKKFVACPWGSTCVNKHILPVSTA